MKVYWFKHREAKPATEGSDRKRRTAGIDCESIRVRDSGARFRCVVQARGSEARRRLFGKGIEVFLSRSRIERQQPCFAIRIVIQQDPILIHAQIPSEDDALLVDVSAVVYPLVIDLPVRRRIPDKDQLSLGERREAMNQGGAPIPGKDGFAAVSGKAQDARPRKPGRTSEATTYDQDNS